MGTLWSTGNRGKISAPFVVQPGFFFDVCFDLQGHQELDVAGRCQAVVHRSVDDGISLGWLEPSGVLGLRTGFEITVTG